MSQVNYCSTYLRPPLLRKHVNIKKLDYGKMIILVIAVRKCALSAFQPIHRRIFEILKKEINAKVSSSSYTC